MLYSSPHNKALLYRTQATNQALIDPCPIADNQAMVDKRQDGNQRLASLIAKAIDQSPLSAKEIADKCEVSPQAVTGWKKYGRIGKETLERLAGVLGLPLSYFFQTSEQQTKNRPQAGFDEATAIAELIAIYARSDALARQDILNFARDLDGERGVSGQTAAEN